MSHFAVMVITEMQPTEEILSSILAPWHEFECTGVNDEHVVDLDVTEESRSRYMNSRSKEEGKTFLEYLDDEAPILGHGEVPNIEGDHKYGHIQLDENGDVVRIVRRTNPNAKWDWWQVGGRFSGILIPKKNGIGMVMKGEPGILGSKYDAKGYDIVQARDLDLGAIRQRAADRASASWNLVRKSLDENLEGTTVEEILAQGSHMSWSSFVNRPDFSEFNDKYRDMYWEQTLPTALRAAQKTTDRDVRSALTWISLDDFIVDHETYVQSARMSAITTYAYIKDGEWHGRGDMGWWGMSSNDVPEETWGKQFNDMIESLPETAWISIIDCHV